MSGKQTIYMPDLLILSLAKKMIEKYIRWKKTKNKFHHHGQIIAWCQNKITHKLLNQQTKLCLTRLHMTLQIILTSSCNTVGLFYFKAKSIHMHIYTF